MKVTLLSEKLAATIKMNFFTKKRDFLKWGAVALATAATPLAFSSRQIRFLQNPFSMGVASGASTQFSVLLWTRLNGNDVDVHPEISLNWEVWEADRRDKIVAKGSALALRELGYSVHVEVEGLQPDRMYEYRFMAGDAVSMAGRTRTLPEQGSLPKQWRLAYASCQRWEDGHYAAYRAMLDDAPDAVVFLGDYIYEYRSRAAAQAVRTHQFRHASTLQDFRDRYALYRSDPLLQQMHAACPWFITWDDHEVENNYAGFLSIEGRPDQFPARRLAAYQAFYENMPLSRTALVNGIQGLLANEPLQLYTHVNFGRLARLVLLDNRQFRDTPLCSNENSKGFQSVCTSDVSLYRSMLGTKQEQWLDNTLQTSKAQWNILAQQTRFTPANYHTGIDQNFSSDTWDGYSQARQRLIDTLASSQSKNYLIIGGDIHRNWIANVHQNPYDITSAIVAAEFCGTSISSRSNVTEAYIRKSIKNNPHCIYADTNFHGYNILDITPRRVEISLKTVRNVEQNNSEVFNLKRFEVSSQNMNIRESN